MSTLERAATVAGKTAGMDPREFNDWLEQRQQAQRQILETVAEQVTSTAIEPLVGARISSCVAGSIFGYEEFHPRGATPPAEQFLESIGVAGVRAGH